METRLRPSGLEWLGDVPWGTHACLFYESKEDLLDISIPYFTAGLDNHECCLCVVSPPLSPDEAHRALQAAMPDFERYLAEGQIEIVSYQDWLLAGGQLNARTVLQNWKAILDWALAKDYAGLRFLGDPSWLEKDIWDSVAEFEKELDEVVGKSQMIGLCPYALERCSARDVLDVMRHHQCSVARRNGVWEHLEGFELKRVHAKIRKLNADLERRVEERTAQLAAANEQLKGEIAERKQSEEALRAREARLQAAIDASDIGLWDWDVVSGQIIWLGHHDKLFGFAPGEFDGTYPSYEKRVHPEDLEELNRVVQRARDEGSEYAHEYRVIWPDGRIHWIAGRGMFVYNETGQPVRMYGAVLDITERKQAEDALRQSEFDLAEAQRVARLGSWSFDIATNTVRWSEELYRILDVDKTAFGNTYESFLSRVHPDDRTQVLQVNAEARSSGAPFEVEYRITTRSGQLKHIREVGYARKDSAGAVSGLFGTAQDITERKQAEAATRSLLQISEKLHATLDIDALLDSLVIEAMKLIDAEIGWSGLRTEEGMVCHTHIARDLQVVPFKYFWPPRVGLPGWVLVHKVPYVMNDAQSDKVIIPEIRERFGVNAAIDTPILDAQGEVIGFFEVNNKKNGAGFSESDVEKLVAVSRIASIALQNAISYGNLERAEKELRESQLHLQLLSRQLLQAQETERRSIARELHDEIGQVLTAVKFSLQLVRNASDQVALLSCIDESMLVVDEALSRVRDLSLDLHPAMLDDLGLVAVLHWYVDRYTQRTGMIAETLTNGVEGGGRLPRELETACFRIVQEALTNVARHAHATSVVVSLKRLQTALVLEIKDDGVGFDVSAHRRKPLANTLGLRSMEERAMLAGGRLTLRSVPSRGTNIRAQFPLGTMETRLP